MAQSTLGNDTFSSPPAEGSKEMNGGPDDTRAMSRANAWIGGAIVLLALTLRLAWLGIKPAHFDEGVNGYFVDQITKQGFYHYDPTNFHGPLHFYILFLAQTLLGRAEWVLRLPVALGSTGCVALVLGYRRMLGDRVCQIAALAMAISPAMVFYGRYAIHETWLMFFLLLTGWGLPGLWHWGERRHLWAAVLGMTGLILTKETYVIHLVSFLLATVCLLGYEKLSPSAEWKFGGWKFSWNEAGAAVLVALGLIVFFYSGGFLDWSSLPGLWETFATWIHTGIDKKTGHEKDWYYWLQVAGRYEWPALLGMAGGFWLLWPRQSRVARWLAIYGLGAFIAYSKIPYKTPWCIISLIWPFYFVFGLAVDAAARWIDTWTTYVLAASVGVWSFVVMRQLNFQHYTDEQEPYVYVQTFSDVNKLLTPLRALAKRDPVNYQLRGHLILPEQYPWVWQLADYPQVDFPTADQLPEQLDADFLLIDNPLVDQVEAGLRLEYYKMPMAIRGSSGSAATLYLFTKTFAGWVPPETPIFKPGEAKPVPPPENAQ